MTKTSLGRLEKVNLRDVWKSEAQDFTPWLAQEENLALLGDALAIELVLEAQERNVGLFRADILCKDSANGNWVLIENQIERTDHTHLGQLLTYAAGLKAVTIVWVAKSFTEEHRSALDWLNQVTNENINFFGLEVELWRIGDSNMAPKFNVVCRPNEWERTVDVIKHDIEANSLKGAGLIQYEFWSTLREYILQRGSVIRPSKPYPSNWVTYAIGRSDTYLVSYLNTRENRLGVNLTISGSKSKAHFQSLLKERDVIEQEIGHPLEWLEKPGGIESHIRIQMVDIEPANRQKWSEYHTWMLQMLEAFDRVLRPRVKQFKTVDELSNYG